MGERGAVSSISAYGFGIERSGAGYRGRILLGLAADEVAYGCVELLFADSLEDLVVLAHAELIRRSMVGAARAREGGPS